MYMPIQKQNKFVLNIKINKTIKAKESLQTSFNWKEGIQ